MWSMLDFSTILFDELVLHLDILECFSTCFLSYCNVNHTDFYLYHDKSFQHIWPCQNILLVYSLDLSTRSTLANS